MLIKAFLFIHGQSWRTKLNSKKDLFHFKGLNHLIFSVTFQSKSNLLCKTLNYSFKYLLFYNSNLCNFNSFFSGEKMIIRNAMFGYFFG